MDNQPTLFDIGFSKAFEVAFNTAIHLDDAKGKGFDCLDGKVVELWIAPYKKPLFCVINQRQIACQQFIDGHADVTLKTGLRQLRQLSEGQAFESKFIRGDEQIGAQFTQALETLEIDWEEHLSHYTGDLLAFKIGHGVRSLKARKQNSKAYIGETFKEYLQFEINALPTRSQVSHFIANSEQLSQQVAAIEARINDLRNQVSRD